MISPLIHRELRVALRKPHLRKVRFWGTFGCAIVATFCLLLGNQWGRGNWGEGLNRFLMLIGVILILRVPTYTVGIFAEERRNQTLGLLILCGLNPANLFAGKTISAVLISLNGLLLLLPFLAISFLGGGLSVEQFTATAVSLPVLLLFVLAVCLLASVLCREVSTAMVLATVIAISLASFPLLLLKLAGPWLASWQEVLPATSPLYVGYLANTGVNAANYHQFWLATALSICTSLFLVVLAGCLLGRVWRDKVETTDSSRWRRHWRDCWHGAGQWRRGLAEKWLSTNPFIWFAVRDRGLVSTTWFILFGLILGFLFLCLIWPDTWIQPFGFALLALLQNMTIRNLAAFAVANPIGLSRSSGALELLLTTPLHHLDIIRGQLHAVRAQFRPMAHFALVLQSLLALVGLATREWTIPSILVYGVVWAAILTWTATMATTGRSYLPVVWDSLVCGRPAFVALRFTGINFSPGMLAYYFLIFGNILRAAFTKGMSSLPTGSAVELFFCGLALLFVGPICFTRRRTADKIESQLTLYFRSIAASPLPEPSDPRYKSWKSGEPFPETLMEHLVRRNLTRRRPGPLEASKGQ